MVLDGRKNVRLTELQHVRLLLGMIELVLACVGYCMVCSTHGLAAVLRLLTAVGIESVIEVAAGCVNRIINGIGMVIEMITTFCNNNIKNIGGIRKAATTKITRVG